VVRTPLFPSSSQVRVVLQSAPGALVPLNPLVVLGERVTRSTTPTVSTRLIFSVFARSAAWYHAPLRSELAHWRDLTAWGGIRVWYHSLLRRKFGHCGDDLPLATSFSFFLSYVVDLFLSVPALLLPSLASSLHSSLVAILQPPFIPCRHFSFLLSLVSVYFPFKFQVSTYLFKLFRCSTVLSMLLSRILSSSFPSSLPFTFSTVASS
jgi:hypothetical protein